MNRGCLRLGCAIASLLAILLGLLFLLAAFLLQSSRFALLLESFQQSCTIGVTGTEASITVQGWMAGKTCNDILSGSSKLNVGTPENLYDLTQPATQPVICEYNISSQRLIVRDEGLVKLVGNEICDRLKNQVRLGK